MCSGLLIHFNRHVDIARVAAAALESVLKIVHQRIARQPIAPLQETRQEVDDSPAPALQDNPLITLQVPKPGCSRIGAWVGHGVLELFSDAAYATRQGYERSRRLRGAQERVEKYAG
jgi:hypothetical protein